MREEDNLVDMLVEEKSGKAIENNQEDEHDRRQSYSWVAYLCSERYEFNQASTPQE